MPERITLDEARHGLGIQLPVRVELHADLGQAKASYMGVCNGSHRIAIAVGKKTKLPKTGTTVCLPDRTETLWHELTHALQCERDYDGNSVQARHHYNGELARRLGVEKEALDRNFLHTLVQRQLRKGRGSAALRIYQNTPWEVEANRTANIMQNIEVTFTISRKTPRGAKC